jgi:hypothetical protein
LSDDCIKGFGSGSPSMRFSQVALMKSLSGVLVIPRREWVLRFVSIEKLTGQGLQLISLACFKFRKIDIGLNGMESRPGSQLTKIVPGPAIRMFDREEILVIPRESRFQLVVVVRSIEDYVTYWRGRTIGLHIGVDGLRLHRMVERLL